MLYAPEQISGFVLEELRNAAQKHFRGLEVSNVVITVPAYFNDDQRQVRARFWLPEPSQKVCKRKEDGAGSHSLWHAVTAGAYIFQQQVNGLLHCVGDQGSCQACRPEGAAHDQ